LESCVELQAVIMYDPYSDLHADNDQRTQSEFWREWTEEDARKVEAGGGEEGRWGECWQWPLVESVSDRILKGYDGRWGTGTEDSLYSYPPPPQFRFTQSHQRNSLLARTFYQQPQFPPPNLQPTPANRDLQHPPPNQQLGQGPSLLQRFPPNPQPGPSLLRTFSPQPRLSCGFCRGNGECVDVYTSHSLRSPTGLVSCPYLRGHVCEICGCTGDQAHTRSYCPQNPGARALPPLLRKTARQSDGKYRRNRRPG